MPQLSAVTTASNMLSTRRAARVSATPPLDIAARSMIDNPLCTGSVTRLLAERALEHDWEALFQFAAVRIGPEAAALSLQHLADGERFGAQPQEGVSARARLYRRMYLRVEVQPLAPLPVHSPLWWVPENLGFRRHVAALRKSLTGKVRDILELHCARGLSLVEVAYVLGISRADVEALYGQGLIRTEHLVGRRPESRDPTPEGALLEAFALNPCKVRAPHRRRRPAVLATGDLVAGRYEVEALLGAGAFADVYRARDREVTDHVVALKILRAESADDRSTRAALRELQLITSVFHPSVVQLKDHGWHAGHLWFVMPLYRGETLDARLKRGPLSRSEARRIFDPLAEALATMHRSGVLHQDIKPENVFLAYLDERPHSTPDRQVLPVLLDFGVAAKDAELVLAGTPAYFAPEVAARFAGTPEPPAVGPKADVFALALTLLHALDPKAIERVPGGTVDAFIRYRATRAPRTPLEGELDDLRESFERWLSFSPDERPTAEQLGRELSVLTRKQERAARRMTTLRTVGPIAIAVVTLFGSAVFGLSREASLQRLEATHARQYAQSVSRSLEQQRSERRALEADVAKLRDRYQKSQMTREQLAARLAETEGQLQFAQHTQQDLREHVDALTDQRESLSKSFRASRSDRRALAQELETTNAQLKDARNRLRETSAKQNRMREKLEVYEAALQEKEAQMERLAADPQAFFAAPDRPLLTLPKPVDPHASRMP